MKAAKERYKQNKYENLKQSSDNVIDLGICEAQIIRRQVPDLVRDGRHLAVWWC